MTKHDSWIQLKDNSPYEPIKHLFPEGLPVRDPFPLDVVSHPETQEKVALWSIDITRLNKEQLSAIVFLVAEHRKVEPSLVYAQAEETQSLGLSHQWVCGLSCGAEGITMQNELARFEERFGGNPSDQAYLEFFEQQIRDWIEGDKHPDPYPKSIEDIHPSLRTPELEKAIHNYNFQEFLARNDYSVLDVVTGDVVIDYLNEIDGEGTWSKAGFEEL